MADFLFNCAPVPVTQWPSKTPAEERAANGARLERDRSPCQRAQPFSKSAPQAQHTFTFTFVHARRLWVASCNPSALDGFGGARVPCLLGMQLAMPCQSKPQALHAARQSQDQEGNAARSAQICLFPFFARSLSFVFASLAYLCFFLTSTTTSTSFYLAARHGRNSATHATQGKSDLRKCRKLTRRCCFCSSSLSPRVSGSSLGAAGLRRLQRVCAIALHSHLFLASLDNGRCTGKLLKDSRWSAKRAADLLALPSPSPFSQLLVHSMPCYTLRATLALLYAEHYIASLLVSSEREWRTKKLLARGSRQPPPGRWAASYGCAFPAGSGAARQNSASHRAVRDAHTDRPTQTLATRQQAKCRRVCATATETKTGPWAQEGMQPDKERAKQIREALRRARSPPSLGK